MIRYENACVSCPSGLRCLGPVCPNRRVPIRVCDVCGRDEDEVTLSRIDALELCERCARAYRAANIKGSRPARRSDIHGKGIQL